MEDNGNNKESDDASVSYDNQKRANKFNKCETLDQGTFAFMHWLDSKDKKLLFPQKYWLM